MRVRSEDLGGPAASGTAVHTEVVSFQFKLPLWTSLSQLFTQFCTYGAATEKEGVLSKVRKPHDSCTQVCDEKGQTDLEKGSMKSSKRSNCLRPPWILGTHTNSVVVLSLH
jgi:hypothetical protein